MSEEQMENTLIDKTVQQHNEIMPHSALRGATPEEVLLGHWDGHIQDAITMELAEARKRRIVHHRKLEPSKTG